MERRELYGHSMRVHSRIWPAKKYITECMSTRSLNVYPNLDPLLKMNFFRRMPIRQQLQTILAFGKKKKTYEKQAFLLFIYHNGCNKFCVQHFLYIHFFHLKCSTHFPKITSFPTSSKHDSNEC